MKRELGILLCLAGAAGCSTDHPPRTAESAAVTPATYDNDNEMRPASSDLAARPNDAADRPKDNDPYHHNAAPPAKDPAPSTATAPVDTTNNRTANPPAAPDNTKVNERDTKSAAPTPLDQGEGRSDLDITKRIRQAVVGDRSLSFTAKNVKIITRDGKVVLRGPVNSAEERASIEAAAQKVAGPGNVDNQLEVTK